MASISSILRGHLRRPVVPNPPSVVRAGGAPLLSRRRSSSCAASSILFWRRASVSSNCVRRSTTLRLHCERCGDRSTALTESRIERQTSASAMSSATGAPIASCALLLAKMSRFQPGPLLAASVLAFNRFFPGMCYLCKSWDLIFVMRSLYVLRLMPRFNVWTVGFLVNAWLRMCVGPVMRSL